MRSTDHARPNFVWLAHNQSMRRSVSFEETRREPTTVSARSGTQDLGVVPSEGGPSLESLPSIESRTNVERQLSFVQKTNPLLDDTDVSYLARRLPCIFSRFVRIVPFLEKIGKIKR